uniref:Microtubule-associated protein n=1 Tax=Denticeps clupeoides TaxID=299321 RepID=A0AAY4A2N3_9TELE
MDKEYNYMNSSSHSHYNNTIATSLSNINDHHHSNQFHKENGVALGRMGPGDGPMKAQTNPEKNVDKQAPGGARPPVTGSKIRSMPPPQSASKTPEASGQSSPGTPKSPSSKALGGKSPASGTKDMKKIAVIRSTPKSPGSNKNPAPLATAAPLPDLKNIKSKIGSTDNMKYQPGGGQVQILDKKVDFSNVQARCGSKDNIKHTPGGGKIQILDQKLDLSSVKSKCGSKDNMKYMPGGGRVQIVHKKIDLSNVQSKCGSKDNITHKAGGGNIMIRSEKLEFKAQSKIGSMDNIGHTPGGGQRRREKGKATAGVTEAGSSDSGDSTNSPFLSSASLSPEPIHLSNPQVKIEDSN